MDAYKFKGNHLTGSKIDYVPSKLDCVFSPTSIEDVLPSYDLDSYNGISKRPKVKRDYDLWDYKDISEFPGLYDVQIMGNNPFYDSSNNLIELLEDIKSAHQASVRMYEMGLGSRVGVIVAHEGLLVTPAPGVMVVQPKPKIYNK